MIKKSEKNGRNLKVKSCCSQKFWIWISSIFGSRKHFERGSPPKGDDSIRKVRNEKETNSEKEGDSIPIDRNEQKTNRVTFNLEAVSPKSVCSFSSKLKAAKM